MKKQKPMEKSEKQFFWLVGIITLLIILVIVSPIIYKKVFNTFEYGGVTFEKVKDKNLVYYHGVFPIIYRGNLSSYHNVFFRTDPRNNAVALNTDITLSEQIYVSTSRSVSSCSDILLGHTQFGMFFNALPFVKSVNGSVLEKDYANETGSMQITCANASIDKTVIIVQNAEASSIDREKENCFVLNVKECDYVPVVEKFIMGAMAQVNGVDI